MKHSSLCLLLFALVLQGCGAAGKYGSPAAGSGASRSAATEAAAIQLALNKIKGADKSDYKISHTDFVAIRVFSHKELDRKMRISQGGAIAMPMIGSVKIGGLSVIEAGTVIAGRYEEYLINPQVSVLIERYGEKKIFVLGEVLSAGSFKLPDETGMTVLEAITIAGGFTEIAAPDRTKVMRVVDGKNKMFTIVVSDITKRGQKDKDITLKANDIVFIPQSFF